MSNRKEFFVKLKDFYQGASPLAHINDLTEKGNRGQYSRARNIDILSEVLTQGQGLENLINGNQTGAVNELIRFILDKAVSSGITYGIGATRLFEITPTAVTNTGGFPQPITNCVAGESIIHLRGRVYYFYNRATDGDIGRLTPPNTFVHNWGSSETALIGREALQRAPHPSANKEDIIAFGNGRFMGFYFEIPNRLEARKLDFGVDNEVSDVVFAGNQWLIAVNSSIAGSNRTIGRILSYEGAAITNFIRDEASIGIQRIGFLYVLDGVVYVAYQDISKGTQGFKIGYLVGRRIKPLVSFSGALPTFAQKTLFRNVILFLSGRSVFAAGAIVDELPFQISQITDGGDIITGAIASPFGVPMIASSNGTTNHRLARFSGFTTDSEWRSLVIPTTEKRMIAQLNEFVVITNTLRANARCDISVEINQGSSIIPIGQITGVGKRRHIFIRTIKDVEDFRIILNWNNGNTINDCPIKEITVEGHYLTIGKL